MEFLYEILFEVYLELMFLIVPEEKATSKAYRYAAIAIATIVLFGVLALFVWGGVLLVDHSDRRGWIPVIVAAGISVVQIIAGIILFDKKTKK